MLDDLSVITFDKITTKRTLAGRGIPLAREIFLRRGEAYDPARIVAGLGLPLFVEAQCQRFVVNC